MTEKPPRAHGLHACGGVCGPPADVQRARPRFSATPKETPHAQRRPLAVGQRTLERCAWQAAHEAPHERWRSAFAEPRCVLGQLVKDLLDGR